MERIVFHLDMDAFFASVEQRDHPDLRGRPVAVCGKPQGRTVVAACSYEAKAFGIKNGMSVCEARLLCPRLVLVVADPGKYGGIARRIFALLTAYTPYVEVFSVDEAFLEVTGTFSLFGPTPEDLARLIQERIQRSFGLTCSIGIGPNKLTAKLASGLRKPGGLVRVRAQDLQALLEKLPVERLCGVGEKLKTRLTGGGILEFRAHRHLLQLVLVLARQQAVGELDQLVGGERLGEESVAPQSADRLLAIRVGGQHHQKLDVTEQRFRRDYCGLLNAGEDAQELTLARGFDEETVGPQLLGFLAVLGKVAC